MPEQPTLTYALRELVWGIESEVAVISNLSRKIDAHVRELNALRGELSDRLDRLDLLRGSVDEVHLAGFLESATVTPLPMVDEHFPERLYG